MDFESSTSTAENKEISHCHNKYEAIPIVLLGNKADLEDKRQVRLKEGMKLADKEMTFAFHETSAKTGQNVFNAFSKLASDVTEICNPIVMKSYHPHLIRNPAVDLTPTRQGCKIMPTGQIKLSKAVKYSVKSQKAEIQPEIVRLKRKHSKRTKCCCIR